MHFKLVNERHTSDFDWAVMKLSNSPKLCPSMTPIKLRHLS